MGNCMDPNFKDKKITAVQLFGDAKSRSGTCVSCVLKRKNGSLLVTSVKEGKDTYYQLNSSGESTVLILEDPPKTDNMFHMLEYEGYLLMFKTKFYLTKDGKALFESPEKCKAKYSYGHNLNQGRGVQIIGSSLYFQTKSSNLIEYDLAVLLKSADKSKLQGKIVYDEEVEDFCIGGDKAVFILTLDGGISQIANQKAVKTFQADNLQRGSQFSTIETCGSNLVTCGFSPKRNAKFYMVMSRDLKEVSMCEVQGIHGGVHSLLTHSTADYVHILAACAFKSVDWLVFTNNALILIDSVEVTGRELYGLAWKEEGVEAIVYGEKEQMKSFKL